MWRGHSCPRLPKADQIYIPGQAARAEFVSAPSLPSHGKTRAGVPAPHYYCATFSISAFSVSYVTAPGWYQATFPARSSSTSVGVVEAP